MENESIIKRIKYIIHEMGLTQAEFAARVGVDSSNLSKYLNGRLAINDSLINRIVINLGLSKEWLTQGTDLPYAKVRNGVDTIEVDGVTSVVDEGRGAPVYDIDVTAGIMPRAQIFANENIVGRISLPSVSTNCRIVSVSGDSMQPIIRNGDMIAVRELSNIRQIFWGHIYVVVLDDYCLVKYVRRHPDPDMVILHSENPSYDDMEIRRADIRDLMIVQHIVHVETLM